MCCLYYYSKLNATQNSFKNYMKFMDSKMTKSQIIFHKKSPPQDFIRKTLHLTWPVLERRPVPKFNIQMTMCAKKPQCLLPRRRGLLH